MTATPEELQAQFAAMTAELAQWRSEHPQASFDEIVAQVTPRRQALMGALLERLALQEGNGYALEGQTCPTCGERMLYKGQPTREVGHREGETALTRAYYYCPRCAAGLFPPGSATLPDPAPLDAGDDSAGAAAGGGDPLLRTSGGELPGADPDRSGQE